MRYKLQLLAAAMMMLLVGVSCVEDATDFYEPNSTINPDGSVEGVTKIGYVSFGSLSLYVDTKNVYNDDEESGDYDYVQSLATRGDDSFAAASDDYFVTITDDEGEVFFDGTYAEAKALTEEQPLEVGVYYLQAGTIKEIPTTSDVPLYLSAKKEFEVKGSAVVELPSVVCTLANIKTTVSLSADLMDNFMLVDDGKVEGFTPFAVKLTYADSSLEYGSDEVDGKTDKYFGEQKSTSIIVKMEGTYNVQSSENPLYNPIVWSETIKDVAVGDYREVKINIDNYSEGKIQISLTLEDWVEDAPLGVSVVSGLFCSVVEDTIFDPDNEITDEFSAKVTLDGLNVEERYHLTPASFDPVLQSYSPVYRAYITPESDATMKYIALMVDSDNYDLVLASDKIANSNGHLLLWENGVANPALSEYIVVREGDDSQISITVTYEGMKALEFYSGDHTFKVVAVDSKERSSYTPLYFTVVGSGPKIEWLNGYGDDADYVYDFETRYRIFSTYDVNQDKDLVNPSIKLQFTSKIESEGDKVGGFTSMRVEIISDTLTPEELATLHLSQSMDLVNPATEEMRKNLVSLGFPVGDAVEGQNNVSLDISSFMPMLGLLGEGDTDFVLYATDAAGTTKKTIKVYYTTPKL